MKDQLPTYSHHFETLIALATFLAMCRVMDPDQQARDNATAPELAWLLGLDISEVKTVLDKFKSLFRKSKEKYLTGEVEDYRYALVLRYAQREYFNAPDVEASQPKSPQPKWGDPLSNEGLFSLLGFIGNKVREEQESQRMGIREDEASKRQTKASRITIIGIGITFFTSLLSLFVALFK